MRLVSAAVLLVLFAATQAVAAPFNWPAGKHAAIVLTYDDALVSQFDIAIPQLDKAGFKGTFFLNRRTPAELLRWRKAANAGHELANHTVSHPCPLSILPGRPNATDGYTVPQMLGEIAEMNATLDAIDGKKPRTLSYPCSQTVAGATNYLEALRQSGLVRYARNGGDPFNSVITDPTGVDPLNVPSNGPTGHPDGAELIAYVRRVHDAGGMGVLQFHGVGGDYLDVSAEAHQQLVDYLKAHPDIWVTTFQDALDYATAQ